MEKFFTVDYPDVPFVIFSFSHMAALVLILWACVLVITFRVRLRKEKLNKSFRYAMGALLLLEELAVQIWMVFSGEWSVKWSLPLHLCGISAVLSVIMLYRKSYSIYELAYFWGFGGALQALLTPDLGPFAFPHLYFYQFFISHGLIIIACVFMTTVEGFRPSHRSIWKTFAATNIYAALIALLNIVAGGNYLYLCHKPASPTLLDLLGPWPWYILSLELVLVLMCYAYYLPFALYRRLTDDQRNKNIGG